MISSAHAFAGPYLEILTPPDDYLRAADGLEAEYERLFDGAGGRLKWVGGRGNPKVEEVGGRRVWRHVAVPVGAVAAPLRWPMYASASFPQSGAKAVADLRGADAEAEVAWFLQEFAEELDLVRRAADAQGFVYGVRWGMVSWVY